MPVAPRIKFCGITTLGDAELALEHGAWAVGVNLWPGSPRCCSLDEAGQIASALRRRAEVAGVFVNAPLDEVISVTDGIGLTIVQLHGDEGPAYCQQVARRTGVRVAKVARVATRAEISALEAFHTDFHLLDAQVAGMPGGTGSTFDWRLASLHRGPVPVIVGGGLTPANVAEAIEQTEPYAVDVASGTEASPGVKDPEKLRAFAAAVASTADGAPADGAPADGAAADEHVAAP